MNKKEKGSIEFITLALLAALILVLAVPVISGNAKPPMSGANKDLQSTVQQPVAVIVTAKPTP